MINGVLVERSVVITQADAFILNDYEKEWLSRLVNHSNDEREEKGQNRSILVDLWTGDKYKQ